MRSVKSFLSSDDDGAAQPLRHGEFFAKRIMIGNKMVKEFHNVIVVELLFVDIDS